jgi:hypothetical protein
MIARDFDECMRDFRAEAFERDCLGKMSISGEWRKMVGL